jgi:hypothetical protein
MPKLDINSRRLVIFSGALAFVIISKILIFYPSLQTDDIARLFDDTPYFYFQQSRFAEAALSAILAQSGNAMIDIYPGAAVLYFVLLCALVALVVDRLTSQDIHFVMPLLATGLIVSSPFSTTLLMFRSAIPAQVLGLTGVILFIRPILYPTSPARDLIISAFGVVLALSSYQPYISLLSVVLVFCLASGMSGGTVCGRLGLREGVMAFLLGAISYGTLMVLVPRLLGTPPAAAMRGGLIGPEELIPRIRMLIDSLSIPYGADDPMTRGGYLWFVGLCLLCAALVQAVQIRDQPISVVATRLLMGTGILLVCSVTAVAPLLLFNTVWIDSRTQFAGAFAVAFAVLYWAAAAPRPMQMVLAALLTGITLFGSAASNRMVIDQITLNRLDIRTATEIARRADDEAGGRHAGQFVLHDPPYSYGIIERSSLRDRNKSALSAPWSAPAVFSLATGKLHAVEISRDDGFCTAWPRWPAKDAVRILGNTAHVCF